MRTLAISLWPVLLMAQTGDVIVPVKYHHTFSSAHPVVARLKPGSILRVKTLDAGGQNDKGERLSTSPNPLSGPFYVEGAEPGDAVTLHIRALRLTRDWGWTGFRLGLFSLSADYIEGIYSNRYRPDFLRPGRADLVRWNIDTKTRRVKLEDPVSKRAVLEFDAQPMLGCIGVAPPGDMAASSSISGAWGGNLDYNAIGEGATVHFPVFHPGALVFVGDGHALQADGEPVGTGIETAMEAEIEVGLRKKTGDRSLLTGPRLVNKNYMISIGSQPEFASSLDRALQMATTDMVRWLVSEGFEPWAAHLLIGMKGKYDVVTVAGSVGLRLPLEDVRMKPANR